MTGLLAYIEGGGGSGGGAYKAVIPGGSVGGSGNNSSHVFGAVTCVASGGIGPYTYLWMETDDGFGTWNNNVAGATITPTVTGVTTGGQFTLARYSCVVTDTGNGNLKTTSNGMTFNWTNTSGGYH